MVSRKGLASVAACAALACGALVRADAVGAATDDGLALRPVYLQDSTQPAPAANAGATQPAPTPKPLMLGLEQTPIGKPLEDAGFSLGGYIDGGYTASFSAPPGNVITGRVFDTKHERIVLDQLDFFVDRAVDYGKAAQNHTIDIGGHIELNYGWDAGLYHSSGIFDNPATLGVTNGYYTSRTHPENQFDVLQAYIDVALPVGSGLRVRLGKFVTPLGYEVINPSLNAFYSHSFEFGFAIPFTQTGVIGEYKINDDWLIDAGITRGWNQSLKDNNGDPDLVASVTYTPQQSDFLKKWKFIGNISEGPQATGDNGDWWTVLDLQAMYTLNDAWNFAVDVDYGDAPHALGTTSAQWFAIAGYAHYTVNKYASVNARAEWYDDNNGFTFGTGTVTNVYEVTLGTTVTPFPDDKIFSNLAIRPEIRLDYAEKALFDGGTDHYQWTFGIDAYFVF